MPSNSTTARMMCGSCRQGLARRPAPRLGAGRDPCARRRPTWRAYSTSSVRGGSMASLRDITRLTARLEASAAAVHAEARGEDPDLASLTRLSDEVGELADRLAAGFHGMNQALELCQKVATQKAHAAKHEREAQPATVSAPEAASPGARGRRASSSSEVQRWRTRLGSAVATVARLSPAGFAIGARSSLPTTRPISPAPIVSFLRATKRAAQPAAPGVQDLRAARDAA